MALGALTFNYTDRKLDLHIMQGVNPPNATLITPSFGSISNYCAGTQKLIQRYTIMLLTELGSQENYPDFGSNLLTTLSSTSSVFNKSDLFGIFALANNKVCNELADYQSVNVLPLDEQINVAELEDIINVGNGEVSLKVRIVPRSTQPVEFLVPLP